MEPLTLRTSEPDPSAWKWPKSQFVDKEADLALQRKWAEVGLLHLMRATQRPQEAQARPTAAAPAPSAFLFLLLPTTTSRVLLRIMLLMGCTCAFFLPVAEYFGFIAI